MADKKPAKDVTRYCQDCKFQSNNPSTCRVDKDQPKYTGRKQTCDLWKIKK